MTAAGTRSSAEATLAVAPPLALLFWLSGAVSPLVALAASALIVYFVFSAGFVFLRLANVSDLPAPAAWVMGIFASATALAALVFAFDLLAAVAFVIWALVVIALELLMRRSTPMPRALQRSELVALLACAAATLYWTWDLAEVPQVLWRDGILNTWVDQFIHGSVISQFGDPRAAGRGHVELADVAREPYHYASYMLPAILAWPLDLPGLTLATSFWVPLGFFTVCAGAYALGTALAGQGGGFAALGALTLLPDAASYGLQNRLYGYYWYVIAVPTASYAVGVALLAIALFRRWSAGASLRALVASGALVAGLVFIRVHIFAVLAPAWIACAALTTRVVQRRALLFAGAGLALFGIFVWGFYHVFPDATLALDRFLAVVHNDHQPVAYNYAGLVGHHGAFVAAALGILLVLVCTVGIFGLLYPVSVLATRRTRRLELIDLVPLALLASYLLLILTAPVPPHGDPTEFTQRPFVLVYAVLAVWTAAGFAGWLARYDLRRRQVWLPLGIAAALGVMWALLDTVADARWDFRYPVAEGLPQAASYVRSHSRPGDLLAVAGLTMAFVPADLPVALTAMSGVPAYLSRPRMHMMYGGARARAALPRYIALRAIERETSPEAALARLQGLGIRWYVVADDARHGPRWDPGRRRAVFVDRMVAVYATR